MHVANTSLKGHLQLVCSARADGTPYLSHQDFRVPVHLSKPHLDEGKLVLNVVNPTAGFFDGDRLTIDVAVAEQAKLVLSTPAASRVYRTRSGEPAVTEQQFKVGPQAALEWIPEAFIPHADACYVQRTRIDLDSSADLLFFDWIAPGRVAMGEVFAYRRLRWELDLTVDGILVARERYDLHPGDESLEALQTKFPEAHYLSVYAAGASVKNWPAEELDALTSENVYLGHGPLEGGVRVIRALCRDSVAARALLQSMRSLLYHAAGTKPPALGRLIC